MARFGATQNANGRTYFGDKDAIAVHQLTVADVTAGGSITTPTVAENFPIITGVTASGADPYPGETGVTVSVSNDGATQGTLTYNGVAVTITGWVQGTYTVTWPALTTGSTSGFGVDLLLIVTTVAPSAPFSQQQIPDPARLYEVVLANDTGVEGTWDDDIASGGVEVGVDLYYALWEPSDTGIDQTNSQKGVWNGVPNGHTLRYRWWDVSLGEWSNEATEDFTVFSELTVGDVTANPSITLPPYTTHVPLGVNNVESTPDIVDPQVVPQGFLIAANVRANATIQAPTLNVVKTLDDVTAAPSIEPAVVAVLLSVQDVTAGEATITDPGILFQDLTAQSLSATPEIQLAPLAVRMQIQDVTANTAFASVPVAEDQPPTLNVPPSLTLFYDDPPGTGVGQGDTNFQLWLQSATAFDPEDGDITGSITTNENSLTYPLVEANTPQDVTWTVSDSAGQTVQETRQVTARIRPEVTLGPGDTGLRLAISIEI